MKRILLISTILLLAISMVSAQAPEMFKYQTVIRNSSGIEIKNQPVTLRISIIKGSANGTTVYSETQHKTTNDFGLINIEIGVGSVESGSFSSINWGSDNYFMKIELDVANGSNYVVMGTSQLLSVPYALHAKTVQNYNEIDPSFSNSPANNISLSSISNWNNAYSWGNHSNAGYLKSFTESDPIFTNSPANNVSLTSISNWNSTFGWGNHAGLYRPINYVPNWTEITNKPTTLAGYGITDAFGSSYPATAITDVQIANWDTAYSWGNHVGLYRPISYVPNWTELTNKPTFAIVATSGSYSDLINKPAGNNKGDMLYWNDSTWLVVPKGTTYQVLTMNENGIPSWQNTPHLTVLTQNKEVIALVGKTTFEIESNIIWTATSDHTWCTTTIAKGNGVDTLKVNYDANTTTSQRIATITISANGIPSKTVTVTQQSAIPTDGLVAYYPFNGNANDESGNFNNGTVYGASLTRDRKGMANNSYSFNGVDNAINVSHSGLFNLDNFTISLWINIFKTSTYTVIMSKGDDGDPVCTTFYIFIQNNKIQIGYEYGSGTNVELYSNSIIQLNNWSHYVFGYNKSTKQLFLYENGLLNSFSISNNIPSFNTDQLRIGAMPNDGLYFKGLIDDIRIYNRTLTDQEIQILYNE